jgi:phage/plasmid primase-like uncharacterized protein
MQLQGVREGRQWRCICPVHGGRSLMVANGRKGTVFFCQGDADCSFTDIIAALRDLGISTSADAYVETDTNDDAERRQREIETTRRLLLRTGPADRTIVETYLRSRGITLPVPRALRFMRFCPHRCGQSFPAMVVPVRDVDGEVAGYHATFLKPDGSGKYPFSDPAMQRECRGVIGGGAVRLARYNPEVDLVVGEGIETVLSCMQLFNLPGWAALSATGLAALQLPSRIRRIAIAIDNDENGAGQAAALSAFLRWKHENRSVQLLMPPAIGDDFNNVLIEKTCGDG